MDTGRRLSFRTAVALGGAGVVLPWIYPFFVSWAVNLYHLAASGSLAQQLYGLLVSREQPSAWFEYSVLVPVGVLMAPLSWAVFFFFLYKEAAGRATAKARRIASGVAAPIMAIAGASMVSSNLLMLRTGLQGDARLFERRAISAETLFNAAFCLAWALFFAAFAIASVPLRRAFTSRLACFLTILTALQVPWAAFYIWSGRPALTARPGLRFSPVRLAVDAVQLSGWALVIVFLLVVWRESRLPRRPQAR